MKGAVAASSSRPLLGHLPRTIRWRIQLGLFTLPSSSSHSSKKKSTLSKKENIRRGSSASSSSVSSSRDGGALGSTQASSSASVSGRSKGGNTSTTATTEKTKGQMKTAKTKKSNRTIQWDENGVPIISTTSSSELSDDVDSFGGDKGRIDKQRQREKTTLRNKARSTTNVGGEESSLASASADRPHNSPALVESVVDTPSSLSPTSPPVPLSCWDIQEQNVNRIREQRERFDILSQRHMWKGSPLDLIAGGGESNESDRDGKGGGGGGTGVGSEGGGGPSASSSPAHSQNGGRGRRKQSDDNAATALKKKKKTSTSSPLALGASSSMDPLSALLRESEAAAAATKENDGSKGKLEKVEKRNVEEEDDKTPGGGWKEFYSNREIIDLIYKDLNRLPPRLVLLPEKGDEEGGEDVGSKDDNENGATDALSGSSTSSLEDDEKLDVDRRRLANEKKRALTENRAERLKMLADILFLYSKEHPDIGYRQGMHEILAHAVLALELDYDQVEKRRRRQRLRQRERQRQRDLKQIDNVAHAEERGSNSVSGEDISNGNKVALDLDMEDEFVVIDLSSHGADGNGDGGDELLLQRRYVKGDSYLLFEAWMDKLKPAYMDTLSHHDERGGDDAATSAAAMGKRVLNLLSHSSPEAYALISQIGSSMGAPPQLYCAKWMRLLFSREFNSLYNVLQLWDEFLNIIWDPTASLWKNMDQRIHCARLASKSGYVRLSLMDILDCAACGMILLQSAVLLAGNEESVHHDDNEDDGEVSPLVMHECLNVLMNYPTMSSIDELHEVTLQTARSLLERKLGIKKISNSNLQPITHAATSQAQAQAQQEEIHQQQTQAGVKQHAATVEVPFEPHRPSDYAHTGHVAHQQQFRGRYSASADDAVLTSQPQASQQPSMSARQQHHRALHHNHHQQHRSADGKYHLRGPPGGRPFNISSSRNFLSRAAGAAGEVFDVAKSLGQSAIDVMESAVAQDYRTVPVSGPTPAGGGAAMMQQRPHPHLYPGQQHPVGQQHQQQQMEHQRQHERILKEEQERKQLEMVLHAMEMNISFVKKYVVQTMNKGESEGIRGGRKHLADAALSTGLERGFSDMALTSSTSTIANVVATTTTAAPSLQGQEDMDPLSHERPLEHEKAEPDQEYQRPVATATNAPTQMPLNPNEALAALDRIERLQHDLRTICLHRNGQ